MATFQRLKKLGIACSLVMAICQGVAWGEDNVNPFTFDFTYRPDGGRYEATTVFCGVEGKLNYNCSANPSAEIMNQPGLNQQQMYYAGNLGNDLESRFIQELVEIDNQVYFHVVVGDGEDSSFAQDFYIKQSPNAISTGGANPSESGGVICFNMSPFDSTYNRTSCLQSNGGADPLRHDALFTGNGTGHPSRVVMKQVLNETATGFSQTVFKAHLTQKPVITQVNIDEQIDARFSMDLSNSDYNTDSTAGVMTNSFDLKASTGVPGNLGDWTYTPEMAGSTITGGRYTFMRDYVLKDVYTRDNGYTVQQWVPNSTYTYYDGSIDPVMNVDWNMFRNPDPSVNPYSLE